MFAEVAVLSDPAAKHPPPLAGLDSYLSAAESWLGSLLVSAQLQDVHLASVGLYN